MARENNYLLGNGEKLTEKVSIGHSGQLKNPPYTFSEAKIRVEEMLIKAVNEFQELPSLACPQDKVVAKLTLHPRYLSKSDYPNQLLHSVNLQTIGSRPIKVKPEKWGIEKHDEEALSEELFVLGTRQAFLRWTTNISNWTELQTGVSQLLQIEKLEAFSYREKLRSIPDTNKEVYFEVVLHNAGNSKYVLETLDKYSKEVGATLLLDRQRNIRGLTFIPVKSDPKNISKLAKFSFIRVARGMPTIRPILNITRSIDDLRIQFPDIDALAPSDVRVAVFDGGLPQNHGLEKWVRLIEPKGIGEPNEQYCEHGLAVTGALLFGPINKDYNDLYPICNIDHYRVIDNNTGNELEYLDVLDRIVNALNQNYEFVNISIGPDIPITDDEITAWTATLDQYLVGGKTITTVAAGNDGELDKLTGLSRIQPPSDGINVIGVGAADSTNTNWNRALYSCIGPGRCPGIRKPDGVAFGGSIQEPFRAIGKNGRICYVQGTSFASPNTLRSAVSTKAQLGQQLSPLGIRALMVHRANDNNIDPIEVGWGCFETDPNLLVTCDDDEALVIYEGELPVDQELRVKVPLPVEKLLGRVTVTATLVIAPDVDPEFPGAYTKSGMDVFFRPHSEKFSIDENGNPSKHPKTKSFFSETNIFGASEYTLREEACKWEPCRKYSRRFLSSSLHQPCFDIKYHQRQGGQPVNNPQPIKYSFIVSVKAPRIEDLYNRVVRTYQNILVPLQPRLHIPIHI